tara:strand:+ start:1586 stop:2239 length:654 start_codon:yes stop_codon:yes gene_type:complete
MAKKCPPGVFCIENYTLAILIIIIIGVLIYLWKNNNTYNNPNKKLHNNFNINNKLDNIISNMSSMSNNAFTRPNSIYTNNNNDVLLNPYAPPNRNDNGMLSPINNLDVRGMPINIRTQGVETNYSQVGILTRITGMETILPLMGRRVISGRDTWNFYTMSDKNNMVKLPITFKNKNCSSEYGCDNISNGDTVYVEGYNDAFKVTMYENNTMRYIPYI